MPNVLPDTFRIRALLIKPGDTFRTKFIRVFRAIFSPEDPSYHKRNNSRRAAEDAKETKKIKEKVGIQNFEPEHFGSSSYFEPAL
jgi:hypothetical protein